MPNRVRIEPLKQLSPQLIDIVVIHFVNSSFDNCQNAVTDDKLRVRRHGKLQIGDLPAVMPL